MNTTTQPIHVNSIDFLERLGMALWIEVITQSPHCIYYFGPFVSKKEAQSAIPEYLEDLEKEKKQVLSTNIRRGRPIKSTIFEEELEKLGESNSAQKSAYFVNAVHY